MIPQGLRKVPVGQQSSFWGPKRDFVGLIMTQMFETPKAGHGRDNEIRGEVYTQIFKNEE